jgi:hypothetical protein
VVVSRHPYPGLCEQVARIAGPAFFDALFTSWDRAVAVLESAWVQACTWPKPIPGVSFDHPLLGRLLHFRCPYIPPDAPTAQGAVTPSSSVWPGAIALAASGGAVCALERGIAQLPRVSSKVSEASASPASSPPTAMARRVFDTTDDSVQPLSVNDEDDSPLPSPASSHSGRWDAAAAASGPVDATGAEEEEEGSGDSPPAVSLTDAFAARWIELPGVFQEIGLFSTYRSLTPCLWTLWELVLLGRPVLVLGPSPRLCGDAIMAMVSLIAPLSFHGDYRPYFTLYDPDFASIQAAFEHPVKTATPVHSALPPSASPILAAALAEEQQRKAASLSRKPDPSYAEVFSAEAPTPTALPESAADDVTGDVSPAGPVTPRANVSHDSAGIPLRVVGRGHKHPFAPPPVPASTIATPGPEKPQLPALPWQTPLLLGTTNPFFVHALAGFPAAVWIGAHPDALPSLPQFPPRRIAASSEEAIASSLETSYDSGVWKRASSGAVLTDERSKALAERMSSMREKRLKQLASRPQIFPKVVSTTASLNSLLPRPGEEQECAPMVILKDGAGDGNPHSPTGREGTIDGMAGGMLVTPDPTVLSQLLFIHPEDEMGMQLRLQGAGTGGEGGVAMADSVNAEGGQVPGVVINDALLRQHFRKLTHSFLKPFERYFRVSSLEMMDRLTTSRRPTTTTTAVVAAVTGGSESAWPVQLVKSPVADREALSHTLALGSGVTAALEKVAAPATTSAAAQPMFGPYDDLGAALLPPFQPTQFLRELVSHPPGKIVTRLPRWRELYGRFLESPHFRPWFSARREEARSRVRNLGKRLRLAVTPEQLVKGLHPPAPLGDMLSAGDRALCLAALRLHGNILGCIQRERQWLDMDPEHADCVVGHLRAVEGVLEELQLLKQLGL